MTKHTGLIQAKNYSVNPTSRFLCVAHLDAFRIFMQCDFCISVKTEGDVAAGCLAGVCSAVIRPDLRLTRAHQK